MAPSPLQLERFSALTQIPGIAGHEMRVRE